MTKGNNNLSELPKGWVWATLGHIAYIVLGQSPPSSTYNENGDGLPFYQGKLEFGKVYPSPRKWCTVPKKIAHEGDVLVSVRAPVGPTNICREKSCIGRGLAAVRGLGLIGTPFILYLMRVLEPNLSREGTGTTFNAVTGNMLRQFSIPLPPLPEQRRIVVKIEELFTRLDAGIEALKRAKKELKRYRQAVLKFAFEGKLTAEWREAHKDELEPASLLLERIKEERKRKAKGKEKELPPLDSLDLPQLPEGWIWARLGSIGKVSSGGTPSTRDQTNFNGDIPWITPADLSGYNGKFISRGRRNLSINGLTSSAKLLPKGTILYSSRAPIGYVAIAKNSISTNQGFKNLTVGKHIFNEYVYFYLKGSKSLADSFASGTTFRELSANRFSQIPFPVSPILEQHKIVEEVESRFSVADEVERTVQQSLKQAGRLRQSILKKAFEGKLVPQDSSDEPAEKLLERIKAEKAKRETEKKRKKRGKTRINLKQRRLL